MKQVIDKNKLSMLFSFFALIILIAVFFAVKKVQAPHVSNQQLTVDVQKSESNSQQANGVQDNQSSQQVNNDKTQQQFIVTIDPIPGALARITKKPFGIYITPKTSPVQPEKFQGYHTGTDLEATPVEQNIDVPVHAMCDGKLLMARFASGYGGVAVQSCNLDGQAVTIVYGHINLSSVNVKVGGEMKAGDFLANLGKGFSSQTDGERKHLHLGIHKGVGVNILGYVQSQSQLSGWLDAAKYLQ